MDDFSPNQQSQEPDNGRIIPDDLDVTPAKRSRAGVFLLFFVAFLLAGGLGYTGYLLVKKNVQHNEPNLVVPAVETPAISLSDLDPESKLQNPVDPYKDLESDTDIIVENADFGDAPEETSVMGQVDYELFGSFPAALDETIAGSIRHLENDRSFFLGMRKYGDSVSLEGDAESVNLDEYDDGVIFPMLAPCEKSSFQVEISIPKDLQSPYYLNALADWDKNGTWSGSTSCNVNGESFAVPEWFIQNLSLDEFYGVLPGDSRRLILPDTLIGPKGGKVWFRFTLTNEQVPVPDESLGWNGTGYFLRGETEDYITPVFGEEKSTEPAPLETTEANMNEGIDSSLLPDFQEVLSEPIFSDVPADHWAGEFIRFVSSEGYMKGFDDKTFKPEGAVSRAELVTIALRLRGADVRGEAPDTDDEGLLDLEELALQTDPKNWDTDGDRYNDYREIMNRLDPNVKNGKLTSIPIPLDTIYGRHALRANVVKALLMGFISQKSFEVKNRFYPDQPATVEFTLNVLFRATGREVGVEGVLKTAQDLGLLKDASQTDPAASVTRAQVAKFVSVLLQTR